MQELGRVAAHVQLPNSNREVRLVRMRNNGKRRPGYTQRKFLAASSMMLAAWGCKVTDVPFTVAGSNDASTSGGQGGEATHAGSLIDARVDHDADEPTTRADGEPMGAGGRGAAGAGEDWDGSVVDGVDGPAIPNNASGGAGGLEDASGRLPDRGGDATGGAPDGGGEGQGGGGQGGAEVGSGGAQVGRGGSGYGGSGKGGATASGGAGPVQQGGSALLGGSAANGGAGGTTATGGSTGTGGAAGCQKGLTRGNNVAVIGDSFIAIAHGLTKDVEALATAAGSLASEEHYDDEAVSGSLLATGTASISNQYTIAQQKNDIKYVLMDGGGNECMPKDAGDIGDSFLPAVSTLFETMATDGVEKVVYFFYPDPTGSNFVNLKSCYEVLRPKLKALCEGLTSPRCYFVDLRDSWSGHYSEYASDGIHPTAAGDTASSRQIWNVMVANCVAQ